MPTTLRHDARTASLRPASLLRAAGPGPAVMLWGAAPGARRICLGRPAGWLFCENLGELDAAWRRARGAGAMLIGSLGYDLGRRLEPAAAARPARASGWPAIAFAHCDEWAALEDGVWTGPLKVDLSDAPEADDGPLALGPLRSLSGAERYQRDVAHIVERIGAGDVYQVNLAHTLRAPFEGDPRALFSALAGAANPWHGAYLELPGRPRRVICSVSPELFLRWDPALRRLTTRPMKGTRPTGADPDELASAVKDTAELNMIIDLMRNDLGRCCAFGSIAVTEPRCIERHGDGPGAVLQATATIEGTLRPGIGPLEAIGAAFPPGSVTGAPKIQAMRMIDALEPEARGPYCGAIGALRPDGSADFNVAIRTALLVGDDGGRPGTLAGELRWSVGAGIVADSDPSAEWQETLDKAAILASAAGTTIEL